MPGGRPRRNSLHLRLTLTLDPVADEDLIQWLLSVPRGQRAAAIRAALRGARPSLSQGLEAGGEELPLDEEQLALDF